jgi:hypothetical protein
MSDLKAMAKKKLLEPDGNRSTVIQTLSLPLNHWANPFWFTKYEWNVWDIRQENPACSIRENQDISLSVNYGRIRGKLTGITNSLENWMCSSALTVCTCMLLDKPPVAQPFNKFRALFMEPEGPLPIPQEPYNCPHPQPDESSPYINFTSLRSILTFLPSTSGAS